MALSHRAGGRFFAAFYRWNQYNLSTPTCSVSPCPRRTRTNLHLSGRHARAFSKAHKLGEHDSSPVVDAESPTPISDHASESEKKPLDTGNEDLQNSRLEIEVAAARHKDQVRAQLRNMPSSVAVITAPFKDPDAPYDRVPLGVAVSSLTSVTLDPPTIVFNLKHPSKTLSAIRDNQRRFRVHFIEGDRGGARIAELFSTGNHPDAYHARLKELHFQIPKGSSDTSGGRSLAPRIKHDSVRAAFECTVVREMVVEDHVILVARVNRVESVSSGTAPTLLYVQGKYIRPDGGIITSHKDVGLTAAVKQSTDIIWDFPVDYQEQHRLQYADAIRQFMENSKVDLNQQLHTVTREVETKLPYSPGAMGINVEHIVMNCKKERKTGAAAIKKLPVLDEFYGRLSPSTKSALVDRLEELAKQHPITLDTSRKSLHKTLGISLQIRDFLPSDLVEPLRARGLVVPQSNPERSLDSQTFNLGVLDEVERGLRDHFKTLPYTDALKMRLAVALEQIGQNNKLLVLMFKKCRHRLLTEAHPDQFTDMEIKGEVTEEEKRVVISRICHHLHYRSVRVFKNMMLIDPNEVLRNMKIHPCISGLDVEFFFAKLKHAYMTTPTDGDLGEAIDKMLEPYFARTVAIADLEEHVKHFVIEHPFRAMQWKVRDQLAFMGYAERVEVKIPDMQAPIRLDKSRFLQTMIAKELKRLHGHGTVSQNRAIAKFLKEKYDFEVIYEPPSTIALSPESVTNSTVWTPEQNTFNFDISEPKKTRKRDPFTGARIRTDPFAEETKRGIPFAEETRRGDPFAQELRRGDSFAEDTRGENPFAKEAKRGDPFAEESSSRGSSTKATSGWDAFVEQASREGALASEVGRKKKKKSKKRKDDEDSEERKDPNYNPFADFQ